MTTQFLEALRAQGAPEGRPLADADAIAAELGLSDEESLDVLGALWRHGLIERVGWEEGERMVRLTPHGLTITLAHVPSA